MFLGILRRSSSGYSLNVLNGKKGKLNVISKFLKSFFWENIFITREKLSNSFLQIVNLWFLNRSGYIPKQTKKLSKFNIFSTHFLFFLRKGSKMYSCYYLLGIQRSFKWPSNLHAKMAMSDLQWYPWKFNLIKVWMIWSYFLLD